MKEKDCRFTQGYIACICAIINGHGINTEVVEAYRAGVGKSSLADLKLKGVDDYDLQTLKKHWKELQRNKP